MPVEGPIGVRTMNWEGGSKIVSPLHSSFTWESAITWAKCNCTTKHFIAPPYDPVEFPNWPDQIIRMDFGRNCGIWAATNILIVHQEYADYQSASVMFLCEGLGTIMLYDEGWRASGVELFAVVKPQFFNDKKLGTHHPYELRMAAAAEYFGIPIIPEEIAELAIIKQMEKYTKESVYDLIDDKCDPFTKPSPIEDS